MKRFYVRTNGEDMVMFVDDKNEAFFMDESNFKERLTLDVAKSTEYENIDGCTTALECSCAMGYGEERAVDFGEFEDDELTEF